MISFIAVLALIPLGTYAASRRLASPEGRLGDAVAVLTLFILGLLAASPFLSPRAVGTGEAYNYSLALADAVLQMREGEIPPLVGQTEFAYNGRIHPLRTAPYLFYLAAGLDAVTGRQLGFWQLQNLALAFSLLAAIHACYFGLRWGAGIARMPSLALSAFHGFSPALLTAAYWYDLFMTVHAVPFVAMAAAATLRQARSPGWPADAWLAVSLAGAWLAHPPVALWATATLGGVRLVLFAWRPSWRGLASLGFAIVLGILLAGFVFASVFTLSQLEASGAKDAMTAPREAIWDNLQAAFPGSLLPVPNERNNLSNLQPGYGLWLLLGLAGFGLWFMRKESRGPANHSRPARTALVFGALALLAFTLPVPGLTPWLWKVVPNFVVTMSSIWPMQRLYLVAGALIIFAAAEPLATLLATRKRGRVLAVLGLALGWTLLQSWPLLQRGFASRWTEDATRRSHLSSNLDLTATSYAFLDIPWDFVNGVMDPYEKFHLITPGAAGPVNESAPDSPAVAAGRLTWPEQAEPALIRLEPGRRYRVDFKFLSPPVTGEIQLTGPSLSRHYALPSAGPARGFGMTSDNGHSLILWTSEAQPEEVRLHFLPAAQDATIDLAEYSVHAIDPQGPVVVNSLLPLRCTVNTPEAGSYLETCRRYLPGYAAVVNGRPVETLRSPGGQLMVPVPKGRSTVEIRYAGDPLVHRAFVAGALAWSLVLVGLIGTAVGLRVDHVRRAARAAGVFLARHKGVTLAGFIVIVATWAAWPQVAAWGKDRATGPLQVEFRLPPAAEIVPGRAEPLIVTGRTGAGDFAYIRYLDGGRVQFGVDHWGVGGATSEPVSLDNAETHLLEVRFGSFYPEAGDRRWKDLSTAVRTERKRSMTLLLDGRVVLSSPLPSHPATNREIYFGLNPIGGSTSSEKFSGDILRVERVEPAHP